MADARPEANLAGKKQRIGILTVVYAFAKP